MARVRTKRCNCTIKREQETQILGLEAKIEALEQRIADEDEQVIDRELRETAAIYANMRAQEAALVLEQMPVEEVSRILYAVSAETAASILGKMKPE